MADDIEYQNTISFEPIYNSNDHHINNNTTLSFVFNVCYTQAPEQDSDGEEEDYDTLPNLRHRRTHDFDKDWLMSGNKDQIKENVCLILEMIDVPSYRDIVKTLTREIMMLKNLDKYDDLPKVERINVSLDVTVYSLPKNVDQYVVRDDVRLVAPAA